MSKPNQEYYMGANGEIRLKTGSARWLKKQAKKKRKQRKG